MDVVKAEKPALRSDEIRSEVGVNPAVYSSQKKRSKIIVLFWWIKKKPLGLLYRTATTP